MRTEASSWEVAAQSSGTISFMIYHEVELVFIVIGDLFSF